MSYRLAVTIAGAVSLGSFEAGVLFELLDALGQHNQAAPPDKRLHIDVLTGASAGGMTAAITAQNALYSATLLADPYNNSFYNAWVAGVDIQGLLPLGGQESADKSVLSSDFVRNLAQKFLLGRYSQAPLPPPVPHPALNPTAATLQLGLALSNLNGVDYARRILSGGTFNYTLFQDQITFALGAGTDTAAHWTPVKDAAVACGAFPFAFRPGELSRKREDYAPRNLAPWPQSPRNFTYTDGGVFQNQPLGMAKNLVDLIDGHQNTETRAYLFVSPQALDPTVGSMTAAGATFKVMTGALVNAVYNQAGFRDWIQAEDVNEDVDLLNRRATQLRDLFKSGAMPVTTVESVTALLLPKLVDSAGLGAARAQLRAQFAPEYAELSSAAGTSIADVWIDTILLLELAADLHERDEMYIYSVTADKRDLAGAGLFSFFGFLDRSFRDHDYDLGRQKAQAFLTALDQASQGKLPRLSYTPKPIHPVQSTPQGGFTAAMIPERNRKQLYDALAKAADNLLRQMGMGWLFRKSVEGFFLNGKIKALLNI